MLAMGGMVFIGDMTGLVGPGRNDWTYRLPLIEILVQNYAVPDWGTARLGLLPVLGVPVLNTARILH